MSNNDLYDFEKEVAKYMTERWEEKEQKGIEETLKYFDRIHDKLFAVNNIFIGGYLALIAFKKDVPSNILWVPMVNLGVLVFIDLQMMKKSRYEANYRHLTAETTQKFGRLIERTNLLSLVSIISTVIETLLFVKYIS